MARSGARWARVLGLCGVFMGTVHCAPAGGGAAQAPAAPAGTGAPTAPAAPAGNTEKALPEPAVHGASGQLEGSASESAFWARCKVNHVGDGSAHRIDCPGEQIGIARHIELGAEREKQQVMRAMGAGVVVEWVSLAGRLLSQGTLDARPATRAALPDEGAFVMCRPLEGADLSPCRARIAWIKARGLPPGVVFAAPILSVLGVGLHVPEGCSMASIQRIQCSRAALDWHQGELPADPLAGYQRLLARLGGRNFRRGPCVAAGHPGQGMTLEAPQPGLGLVRVEVCVASTPDGKRAVVGCAGPRRPDGGYEPPCDQVFGAPPK